MLIGVFYHCSWLCNKLNVFIGENKMVYKQVEEEILFYYCIIQSNLYIKNTEET
jgi:hypothetical protein